MKVISAGDDDGKSRTSFNNLPLEIQHKILYLCNISDVLSFSDAFDRPSLNLILEKSIKWKASSFGPRLYERSVAYLGSHTHQLRIIGTVKFDKRNKPKKTKYFKSKELLPKFVITSLSEKCSQIKILHLDKCVLGPHLNNSLLPQTLETLIVKSCVFVKKTSFFTNIWSNLKELKELIVMDIQNFDKDDLYAVIISTKIDFDILSDPGENGFVFYRGKL